MVKPTLRLVNQFAIANHDDLGVVALDLHDVLEHVAHFREVRPVVLLHLENSGAGARVQGQDHEGVGLSEARTFTGDLLRGWHDLSLSVVEDYVSFVGIVFLYGIQLEENLAGRSSQIAI